MRSPIVFAVLPLVFAAGAHAEPPGAPDRVAAALQEPSLVAAPHTPVERERLAVSLGSAVPAEVAPAAPEELRGQFESFILQREFESFLRHSGKPARP